MDISINSKEKKVDSFETAITALEEIVKNLDEGKLTLDDTLSLYEEGIRLYRYCNDTLRKAEQKISILVNDQEEPMDFSDFDNLKGD